MITSDRILSWMTGVALVLFSLHTRWFVLHDVDGMALIFLPQWGAVLLGIVAAILWKQDRLTLRNLGPKAVWIPLVIIVGFICFRFVFERNAESMVECGIAVMFFASYLVGRVLGVRIFEVFVPLVIVEALSCIMVTILSAAQVIQWRDHVSWDLLSNGGLLSISGYDVATAFMAIGGAFGILTIRQAKWKAMFMAVTALGIVFTGSAEGIVVIGCVALAIVVRRDWNRYALAAVVIMGVSLSLWFGFGYGEMQQQRTTTVISDWDTWGSGRFPAYERTLHEASFFGHGYDLYRYPAQREGERDRPY